MENLPNSESCDKDSSFCLPAFSLNVICASFFLAMLADGYSQFHTTGIWIPREWEIAIWTTAIGIRSVYGLKRLKD